MYLIFEGKNNSPIPALGVSVVEVIFLKTRFQNIGRKGRGEFSFGVLNWGPVKSMQTELSFWYIHDWEYKAQRKDLEWQEMSEGLSKRGNEFMEIIKLRIL